MSFWPIIFQLAVRQILASRSNGEEIKSGLRRLLSRGSFIYGLDPKWDSMAQYWSLLSSPRIAPLFLHRPKSWNMGDAAKQEINTSLFFTENSQPRRQKSFFESYWCGKSMPDDGLTEASLLSDPLITGENFGGKSEQEKSCVKQAGSQQ